jgi:hypothetical protein
MRDAFFQALMVTPPVVCGRRLLPYSIGHEYVLRRVGSPFIVGGDPRREDVLTAIAVCSRTMAENRALLALGGVEARGLYGWAVRWSRFDVGTATASQTITFVWLPIYGWE